MFQLLSLPRPGVAHGGCAHAVRSDVAAVRALHRVRFEIRSDPSKVIDDSQRGPFEMLIHKMNATRRPSESKRSSAALHAPKCMTAALLFATRRARL